MDRNTLIGFLLIGAILIVFSIYNQKSLKELQEQQVVQDTLQEEKTAPQETAAEQLPEATTPDTAAIKDTSEAPADQGIFKNVAEEKTAILENEVLKVTLSGRGGNIQEVELKDFKTYSGNPLILTTPETHRFSYDFVAGGESVSTAGLNFELVKQTAGRAVFRAYAGEGQYIEQEYILSEGSYLIDYNLRLKNFQDIIPRSVNYITLGWQAQIRQLEKSLENERNSSTIYYKFKDDEVDYLTETEAATEKIITPVSWVSFKQKFFNQTIISKNGFDEAELKTTFSETDTQFAKTLTANLILPYNNEEEAVYPMQFYLGPNHYNALAALDNDMKEIVPLGWGIFGWVNKFFIIPIFDFLNEFIGNYGIIILIMTLVIKMILFPLTYKSYLSMAKMRVLQPEIQELKEKYKDAQKLNMEQMKLYQRAGVNPIGGCLPMLLQMPILVAMYYFFPSSIELRQESFLWAEDLSTYDSIMQLPWNIPFYGDHVSLFTLLMTVSTLIYTHFNSSQMTAGPANMKVIQYVMPVMFLGIFNSFAAALTYYYFLANVISFGQQLFIRKFIVDEDKIHQRMQERKKQPRKKSKWQMRLEQLQKVQQEQPRKKRK